MLIKNASITFKLGKTMPAVFFLLGQEPFQLNTLSKTIKLNWCERYPDEVDSQSLQINAASDWLNVAHEANSYSLFSSRVLIDVYYDKKTLEAAGKNFLERYLQKINQHCLLIFRAPNLPLKQLQSFVNHEHVQVILSNPPEKNTILQWIRESLGKMTSQYDQQIPALILQYNEGNLLACSQVLDKLQLIAEPNTPLTLHDVEEQLSNQCSYSLFELGNACLTGDLIKALQLLQQAQGNKTEPTLILWLFTQEIRLLMQLIPFRQQNQEFRDVASQLKIWSQRVMVYQSALRKYQQEVLIELHQFCNKLDSQIKTSQSKQIWQSFELLALSLCTGKKVGICA